MYLKLKWVVILWVSLWMFSTNSTFANNENMSKNSDLWQQGENLLQRGAFEQAIQHWNTLLNEKKFAPHQHVDVLINLTQAYQAVGSYSMAHATLQSALSIAKTTRQRVLLSSYLGDVLLAMQQPEAARKFLEDNLTLARTLDEPLILAHLLNNLGNVLSVQQNFTEALKIYAEVEKLASGDIILQTQALSNQTRALAKLDNTEASIATLKTAISKIQKLPDNHHKGFLLLGLVQQTLRLQKPSPFTIHHSPFTIITTVIRLAKQLQDKHLMAQAKGFLGQLYERKQRYQEALQLTNEAIFLSQEDIGLLYLWEWQQGRILQAQQKFAPAKMAYQQALEHLHPIKTSVIIGQRNAQEVFRERIRPVYFALADILLQQATTVSAPKDKKPLLIQAINRIEQLKAAELQDYFQDECVAKTSTKLKRLEAITDKHTAIFYPILLPDRTELLLNLPDGIHQIIVPVDGDTLGQTALKLRENLQISTSGSFITQSKQLYEWLITPILDKLIANKINTLVIVPDGPLRMIPFSALYNSKAKNFLFHSFAIAITPGLKLTDPRPLPRKNMSILLNGLSESVQNFAELPNVPNEINNIKQMFANATVLLNQTFSLKDVSNALQTTPYSIVHVASHGQFHHDPNQTFLLTYDDKLTMNRLENLLQLSQSRDKPVELLTLSACQTAVGDERAALGLAGIAIKAGVRSALASLWFVNDEATSQLVIEFYKQLQNPALSKAQALQNAQKKLAAQRNFRHPAFWAPFLLIGNWL